MSQRDLQRSATLCTLCDRKAEYLTPFGLYCKKHTDPLFGCDERWLPIPIDADRRIPAGTRGQPEG